MKKKKLNEIFKGKYKIEGTCIYKNKIEICNFYIKDLTINRNNEKNISFTITLESDKIEQTETIPICYIYEPNGWLCYGFDIEDFTIKVSHNEFDKCMIDIINLIIKNRLCSTEDFIMGWDFGRKNPNTIYEHKVFSFNKYEDPSDIVFFEEGTAVNNHITDYMHLVDMKISVPLLAYMLLSLLNSFDLLGDGIRPDFIMAVTGGTEEIRRKIALFYTNLFKRSAELKKNDYKFFHVMKTDSFSDIRFKAEFAKDCVLIAFDPDKRHLNCLTSIYNSNSIDEERPIRSLCVITTDNLDGIQGDFIDIKLDENFDTENIEKYFDLENPINAKEDNLINSVYYYIYKLIYKLSIDKNYINKEYKKYRDNFLKEHEQSDFSEKAYYAGLLLSFAFYLYIHTYNYYKKNKEDFYKVLDFEKNVKPLILNTVKNAFPLDGRPTDNDLNKAKELITAIDNFFKSNKNRKKMGLIGDAENVTEIKMWHDNESIYITSDNISEILKLQDSKLKFSIKIKKALADANLIKTYTKKDEKIEYSVHLQKPLYGTTKSKSRYISFNIEECRKNELFTDTINFIEKTGHF